MPNPKTFVSTGEGTDTTYLTVQRVSDGYWLQSASGEFADSPSLITMDAPFNHGGSYYGYREWVEDREVWPDGMYRVAMGPSTGTGVYRADVAYQLRVLNDSPMDTIALSAVTARNAAAAFAPVLSRLEAAAATITTRLKVIESRLSSIDAAQRRALR